ncbi:MAG: putative bifunctional diguanylate cyclase/phosphodiesterase, partial [Spirochaetia bacterium]
FDNISPPKLNQGPDSAGGNTPHHPDEGIYENGSRHGSGSFGQLKAEYDRLASENTRLEKRIEELEQVVNIDPQTGLPIRRVFVSDVTRMLSGSPANGETFLVIGVIRLDSQYRRIRAGRDRSNALLFKSTIRIRSVVGEHLYQSDRFDEFIFVQRHLGTYGEVPAIGERIASAVSAPHDPPAEDINFGCSVGLSIAPRDGNTVEELVEAASIAVDTAETGDNRVILYSADIGEAVRRRQQIEQAMARALGDGFAGFFLEYQPIVSLDGTITGAEALIRLRTPELGLVSPGLFIPIAEESGDIRVLGQWIIYSCCRRLQQWHEAGFTSVQLSVNLSALQFKQADLPSRIKGVLKATGLAPQALKVELTESMLMEDPEQVIRNMQALRGLGISLLIDDFGTGYSSLAYLRRLPVDVLKVDKSFVDRICESKSDQQIVRAIVSMARSLQLSVLAEGVEDTCQLEHLREIECDFIQGFHFSRPVSAEKFRSMLETGKIIPGSGRGGES